MQFPSLIYGQREVVRKRCRQLSKKLLQGQEWNSVVPEDRCESLEIACEYYTIKPWAVPRQEQGVHFYMLLDVAWADFEPFFGQVGGDEWPQKFADEAVAFLAESAWGTFCLMGNGGSEVLFCGSGERRRNRKIRFVSACVRHWQEMREVTFRTPTFWRCIALRQVLIDAGVPSTELAGHREPWWSKPEELLARYSVFPEVLETITQLR